MCVSNPDAVCPDLALRPDALLTHTTDPLCSSHLRRAEPLQPRYPSHTAQPQHSTAQRSASSPARPAAAGRCWSPPAPRPRPCCPTTRPRSACCACWDLPRPRTRCTQSPSPPHQSRSRCRWHRPARQPCASWAPRVWGGGRAVAAAPWSQRPAGRGSCTQRGGDCKGEVCGARGARGAGGVREAAAGMLGCLSGAHMVREAVRCGGKRIHYGGTVREDELPSCSRRGSCTQQTMRQPCCARWAFRANKSLPCNPAWERSMTRRAAINRWAFARTSLT